MLQLLSSWAERTGTGAATSFIRKNYQVPAEREKMSHFSQPYWDITMLLSQKNISALRGTLSLLSGLQITGKDEKRYWFVCFFEGVGGWKYVAAASFIAGPWIFRTSANYILTFSWLSFLLLLLTLEPTVKVELLGLSLAVPCWAFASLPGILNLLASNRRGDACLFFNRWN